MKVFVYTDPKKNEKHYHLLVDSIEMFEKYVKLDSEISAESAYRFWSLLKSLKCRTTSSHYTRGQSAIIVALGLWLDMKEGDTSLIEYCAKNDSLVSRKHVNMSRLLNEQGGFIVNWLGGYSPIPKEGYEIEEYDDMFLSALLLTGTPSSKDLTIQSNRHILFIENQNELSEEMRAIEREYYRSNVKKICPSDKLLRSQDGFYFG